MNTKKALLIFRIIMPLFMVIHGVSRAYKHDVAGFGSYLTEEGFPAGLQLAWTITCLDAIGSLCIIAGFLVRVFCCLQIIELSLGIIMVHYACGWFVVGGGNNGMEYSILIILCLSLIAITNPLRKQRS